MFYCESRRPEVLLNTRQFVENNGVIYDICIILLPAPLPWHRQFSMIASSGMRDAREH